MFFKKKKISINLIEIANIEPFVESSFKESTTYASLSNLQQKFEYEFNKLDQYSEVLLSRDFETRITQDREFFKKLAEKVHNSILAFLSESVFPKSVFLLSSYEEKTLELIENLESEISVNLNKMQHIMPKLITRINSKLEAIHDLLTDYHRFLETNMILHVDEISSLMKNYYEIEDKIHILNQKRIPILDELTQVSMMKDRVDVRLRDYRNKKSMSLLNKKLNKRDIILKKLKNQSSLIKLNLSYIVELIEEVEYESFSNKFKSLIDSQDFINEESFSKLKKTLDKLSDNLKLGDESNYKTQEFISTIKNSEPKLIENLSLFKEIKDNLHNNVLYLNIKEQEDSFDLWDSKFKNLKHKIKKIDNEISDLSISLIKQKLNKEIQAISPNTVIN